MRDAVNGIRERWIWIRQHWILITFLSVALYILPFIQTQWAVHGYPGFLGFLNPTVIEKSCTPGVVVDRIASDRITYLNGGSASHNTWNGVRYYLVLLTEDHGELLQEVSVTQWESVTRYSWWSCKEFPWPTM